MSAAQTGAAPKSKLSKAAVDVLAERHRQINEEGWELAHDDEHTQGSIARAAAAYALAASYSDLERSHGNLTQARGAYARPTLLRDLFPWHWSAWKPKDRRTDLVRAGALILAEIERLDRLAARKAGA